MTEVKKPSRVHMRGFASLSQERRSEIARQGGASVPAHLRSFSRDRDLAKSAGTKGGSAPHSRTAPATEKPA